MIKSELVAMVAKENGLSHTNAERVVATIFDTMTKALINNGRIELRGFGVLSVHQRKAKTARNPKTGAYVQVKAKRVPFFRAGKAIKDALNATGGSTAPKK